MPRPAAILILEETVSELLGAPIWWYTRGAISAARRCEERLQAGNDEIGWTVWMGNIFTPMYGQTDMAGRSISVVVRLVQVLVRSLAMMVWVVISVLFFAGYLLLPVFVIAALVGHAQLFFR